MRSPWLAGMLASACYHPTSAVPCTATCDFDNLGPTAPCPDGLTCIAGGRCANEGATCGPNGEIDAMPDGPPCSGTAYGHDLIRLCFKQDPTTSLDLSTEIDTADPARCDQGTFQAMPDPSLCVVAGTDIHIKMIVHASGPRPVVLVAKGVITVDGQLDAVSTGPTPGAAGNWIGCDANGTAGTQDGGGAGGSFHGRGGSGGSLMNHAGLPGPILPVAVHGGCAGGSSPSSAAGAGGGALYLIARGGTITVNGAVLATGGGGAGGAGNGFGGGGGGAGGFIGLDAPTISFGNTAVVVASGGGGGGGGSAPGTMTMAGQAGTEPSETNSWMASGGHGGVGMVAADVGGNGGNGSTTFPTGGPGLTGSFDTGGGGGGGGAGYIRVWAGAAYTPGPATVIPAVTR